jgi:peptide/nickel transport system ATP-binding protein
LLAERQAALPILSDISFQIRPGEIVGLLGESGCGKTTLALALLGLLPPDRFRTSGSVWLHDRDLLSLPERRLEPIRGAQISLVFQDPLLALNPVLRVRTQLAEAAGKSGMATGELRDMVDLPSSSRFLDSYAHQLSGGERQRVLLALALARRPALVVADEPFTALDAPRVVELARLFVRLKEKLGTAFLVISHSPGVLARIAGHVLVMYGGRLVERGRPDAVLAKPLDPYTVGLLGSLALVSIPGNPPGLAERARGCPFEPRCSDRLALCAARMPAECMPEEQHYVRCFKYGG